MNVMRQANGAAAFCWEAAEWQGPHILAITFGQHQEGHTGHSQPYHHPGLSQYLCLTSCCVCLSLLIVVIPVCASSPPLFISLHPQIWLLSRAQALAL